MHYKEITSRKNLKSDEQHQDEIIPVTSGEKKPQNNKNPQTTKQP